MNKANIENIRSKLKGIAMQRFGLASTYYDGACIAVDMLCDAKIAEADLVSNSISSYSIQGRSITKRKSQTSPGMTSLPIASSSSTRTKYRSV